MNDRFYLHMPVQQKRLCTKSLSRVCSTGAIPETKAILISNRPTALTSRTLVVLQSDSHHKNVSAMPTTQLRLNGQTVWTLTGKIQPDSTPQTVDVAQTPFRIGRRPDADLSVSSAVVSGIHVVISSKGGILSVADAGSTNGTFVNGKKINEEILLAEGDWIEIGDINLKVGLRSNKADGELVDTHDGFSSKTLYFGGDTKLQSRGFQLLIEECRLCPCFQAIHDLTDRDVHGYEFLARSEVDGVTNPAEMFAAAEAAGRERELSMMCREQAVVHSLCLPSSLPLFMNTHPSEDLMAEVVPQMQLLRDRQPARPMVLEIHEHAIMEPGLVRNLRAALKEMDIQLAFDDFGAGQARFRELICAPSDYIKFDSSLIHDLEDLSKEQFKLFSAIISGVRGEGALTVAEGVENEKMIEICQEVGFDLLQGYALSRPTMMKVIDDDSEDTVEIS